MKNTTGTYKPKAIPVRNMVNTELQITVKVKDDTAVGAVHAYLKRLTKIKNMPYSVVSDIQVYSYMDVVTFRTEISRSMSAEVTESWITNWLIPELYSAAKDTVAGSIVTVKQTRLTKVKGAEKNRLTKCAVVEYSAEIPCN